MAAAVVVVVFNPGRPRQVEKSLSRVTGRKIIECRKSVWFFCYVAAGTKITGRRRSFFKVAEYANVSFLRPKFRLGSFALRFVSVSFGFERQSQVGSQNRLRLPGRRVSQYFLRSL